MGGSRLFVSLVIAIGSLVILVSVFVDISPPAGFNLFFPWYQKRHLYHDNNGTDTRTDSVAAALALRDVTPPLILPRNDSFCRQLKPRSFTAGRIVYNRLPKCASMTVTSMLMRLSIRNNFQLTVSEEYNKDSLPTAGEQVTHCQ